MKCQVCNKTIMLWLGGLEYRCVNCGLIITSMGSKARKVKYKVVLRNHNNKIIIKSYEAKKCNNARNVEVLTPMELVEL